MIRPPDDWCFQFLPLTHGICNRAFPQERAERRPSITAGTISDMMANIKLPLRSQTQNQPPHSFQLPGTQTGGKLQLQSNTTECCCLQLQSRKNRLKPEIQELRLLIFTEHTTITRCSPGLQSAHYVSWHPECVQGGEFKPPYFITVKLGYNYIIESSLRRSSHFQVSTVH